nr:MAG TPA: hypothetical protein [Caudoviricetes sp.]
MRNLWFLLGRMGAIKRSPKLACESWFRTFLLVETLKKLSETLKFWSKLKILTKIFRYVRKNSYLRCQKQ